MVPSDQLDSQKLIRRQGSSSLQPLVLPLFLPPPAPACTLRKSSPCSHLRRAGRHSGPVGTVACRVLAGRVSDVLLAIASFPISHFSSSNVKSPIIKSPKLRSFQDLTIESLPSLWIANKIAHFCQFSSLGASPLIPPLAIPSYFRGIAPPLHQVVAHVAPGVLSSILARVLVDQTSGLKAAKQKG